MSIVLLLTNCADHSVHDQSFDNCSGDCSCGVSSLLWLLWRPQQSEPYLATVV